MYMIFDLKRKNDYFNKTMSVVLNFPDFPEEIKGEVFSHVCDDVTILLLCFVSKNFYKHIQKTYSDTKKFLFSGGMR